MLIPSYSVTNYDVSFFASATSVADAIVVPLGILAGDLILLHDVAGNSPDAVTPTGFTLVNDQAAGTERTVITYKKADGTEGGMAIIGMNDIDVRKIMLVFRSETSPASFTVSAVNTQGTGANPTAQTVTASAGVAPLVVFGAYSSDGAVNPRTFTVAGVAAKDSEVSSTTKSYVAWKIYNSAPQDVVVDMNDEGSSNNLNSFYMTFVP